MRKTVVFTLNGTRRALQARDATLPLSRFLRERERLTGTKIACSEGSCGTCTVLLGTPDADADAGSPFAYRAVNACLLSVYQVDGCHLVTIEGVSPTDGTLSPVQKKVVDCHGTQCGFCTPGIVLTLTAAKEAQKAQTAEVFAPDTLTGNLCRCTGYLGIREAAAQIAALPLEDWLPLSQRYPSAALGKSLARTRRTPFLLGTPEQTVFAPVTLDSALEFLSENPEALPLAGATEINVEVGAGKRDTPQMICWLGRIAELTALGRDGDTLTLGAGATWTEIEAFAQTAFPPMAELLRKFAGPQIKNIGTLGGNILRASPIADSLPLLHVLGARAVVAGPGGVRREAAVEGLTLQPGEILVQIILPLPGPDQILRRYKVSRRQAFNRAAVNAAICITVSPETDVITAAQVVMGGLAASVRRLTDTEAALTGKPFEEKTFQLAGDIARGEAAATAEGEYQSQLAGNLVLKFFNDAAAGTGEDTQ